MLLVYNNTGKTFIGFNDDRAPGDLQREIAEHLELPVGTGREGDVHVTEDYRRCVRHGLSPSPGRHRSAGSVRMIKWLTRLTVR